MNVPHFFLKNVLPAAMAKKQTRIGLPGHAHIRASVYNAVRLG